MCLAVVLQEELARLMSAVLSGSLLKVRPLLACEGRVDGRLLSHVGLAC